MSWSRLETSKSLLNIHWSGAVPSIAAQVRKQAEAIDELANGDPRPLLILLDSKKSDKKVQALLDACLKSERFTLASNWFHCVRIDESVLDRGHPYHALFQARRPARLTLISRGGGKIVRFLGTAQQKVTWSGIASVLKKDYRKDPTSTVKSIERLLSRFDALDDKRKELHAQLAKAAKNNQRDKQKLYEKRLAALDQEQTTLFAQKAKLEKLGLRAQRTRKAG